MSILDNFMSQVVDLDEKEKEQTILFLATALVCGDPSFIRNVSKKVTKIVLPFLVDVLKEGLERKIEGGEKVESRISGRISKRD